MASRRAVDGRPDAPLAAAGEGRSAIARFASEGPAPGDLRLSAAAMLEDLRPRLRHLGITRVARLTGLDRIGLPVAMAVRPLARAAAVALGKGYDWPAAEVSAIMEAAESWHAERVAAPLRFGSAAELGGELPLLELSRLRGTHCQGPLDELRLLWLEGRDLRTDAPLWLPLALVHTDYTLPQAPGSNAFATSTTGLAAGTGRLGALCHALAEIIERDATARWQEATPSSGPRRIDLDRLSDPACRALVQRMQAAGFALALWDTTGPTSIPSCYAGLLDERDPTGPPGIGSGCHLDPQEAAGRALIEAVQVRLTQVSGARDDLEAVAYSQAVQQARARALRRLMAGPAGEAGAWPGATPAPSDGRATAEALLRGLERAGCREIVAVGLERPEIGLAVVKVVVPAMRDPDLEADA